MDFSKNEWIHVREASSFVINLDFGGSSLHHFAVCLSMNTPTCHPGTTSPAVSSPSFKKMFICFCGCTRPLSHVGSLATACEPLAAPGGIQSPDQGSNLGPLHWGGVDSLSPWSMREVPHQVLLTPAFTSCATGKTLSQRETSSSPALLLLL